MSRDEVLEEFEIDFADPESKYSGNSLYERVLKRAKQLVPRDREGLIEACRYWLSMRKLPHTWIGTILAKDLVIRELKPDLENLREDIESGKVFKLHDIRWVDKAIAAISTRGR